MQISIKLNEAELAELGITPGQLEKAMRNQLAGPLDFEAEGGDEGGIGYLGSFTLDIRVVEQ